MTRAAVPRVLVIDDSGSARERLRLHLANAGYDVVVAEDVIEAGKALFACFPDLIITVLELPYMSGSEFVAALRADRTIPEIPVVLLSSAEDAAHHARQLNAVAHLPRPVGLHHLLEVVGLYAGEARNRLPG